MEEWDEAIDLKVKSLGRDKGRLVNKVTLKEVGRSLCEVLVASSGRHLSCLSL